MPKTDIKISPQLQRKIDNMLEELGDEVGNKMADIATTIVVASPVDTGAFVNSWSFKDNLGGGRAKSSAGKPKNQPPAVERNKSLNNLVDDIRTTLSVGSPGGYLKSGLTVSASNFYFINRSPHALIVEDRLEAKNQSILQKVKQQHG